MSESGPCLNWCFEYYRNRYILVGIIMGMIFQYFIQENSDIKDYVLKTIITIFLFEIINYLISRSRRRIQN